MIPGFEDAIVGMSAGETKDCALTFPADYHVESLKGANVNFAITLNSVSAEQLPAVDDTFLPPLALQKAALSVFAPTLKQYGKREKQGLQEPSENDVFPPCWPLTR